MDEYGVFVSIRHLLSHSHHSSNTHFTNHGPSLCRSNINCIIRIFSLAVMRPQMATNTHSSSQADTMPKHNQKSVVRSSFQLLCQRHLPFDPPPQKN
jgi:hypothetical protein